MAGGRCCPAATLTLTLLLAIKGYAFNLELTPYGDVWARIGDKLELKCVANNCLSPTFSWRTGTDRPLGGKITTRGTTSTITFSAVTPHNELSYTCASKCGAEEKRKKVNLSVFSLSDTLTVESVGSLEVGRKGTVRCTVPKVYPAHVEVEWLKGTTLLKTDQSHGYAKDEMAINFTYELTAELGDSGQELTCRVRLLPDNPPGWAQGTLTLQVDYAPTGIAITAEPPGTVREGQDARLTCAAASSPAARTVWSKLSAGRWSVVAEDRAILHLSPALLGDMGTYRCEASNKLGTIARQVELQVQGSPRDTTLSITPSPVKEGDRVTFSCTTHSNPPAQLVLSRQSSSGWSELVSENGTWTIRAVQPADAGLYQCEATNALGSQSNSTKLQVQGSPRDTTLSITPSPVKEGDRVTFSCTTHSNPPAQLVLSRQSSSGWSELVSENGTWTIRAVQPADAGLYQCEATNALGSQSNSTKLQVQGSPRDTTLSITPSPVKEGDRVTFSCTTHSNPPAQLVLSRQSSSGWSELVSENGTWTIRAVQPADAGLYQCEATNALGSQSNSTKLQVQGSPRDTTLSITPSPVKEGDRVTFSCTTHSNPPAQLVLSRQSSSGWSELVSENGTWTIRAVQPADAGLYQCEATNALGSQSNSTKLQVQGSPRDTTLSITPSPVKEGDRVTFSCTTHSNPPAQLVLSRQSSSGWSELVSENGTWTIRAVQPADAGLYQCEATNALGSQSNSTKLQVQGSPRDTTLSITPSPVKEGDRVTFSCTTHSNPPAQLVLSRQSSSGWSELVSENGTWTIRAVQPADAGLYQCEATNALGSQSNSTKLQVQGSPRDTTLSITPSPVKEGDRVTFSCTTHSNPPAQLVLSRQSSSGWSELVSENGTWTIRAVQPADAGLYQCEATNALGSQSNSTKLQVQGSPRDTTLSITPSPVKEGDRVTFSCTTHSNPPAQLVLSRQSSSGWSELVSENGTWTIRAVQPADAGLYQCEATNALGSQSNSTKLQVQGSPRDTTLSITPSPVKEGDRVTFSCTTHSNPPAQLVLSRQSSSGWSELVSENGTWTIRAVQPADAGLYQCEATNALGSQSNSTKLQVQGSPRDTTLSITPSPVKEGDRVTFSCTTHSNPPAQLVLSRQSSSGWSELVSENGTWTIRAVQPADAGLYQCEATNALGSQSNSTKLQVQGSPRDTTLSITPSPVKEGDRVTFSCTTHSNPPAQLVLSRQSSSGWSELVSENGTWTIRAVQPADAGLYQCEATNALGSQSNSTKLQVQGSPRDTTLSITPSPVKEGDRVTFSCTTHSNPPAQLVLSRQSSSGWSELVSENGTWTIRAVQPADAGLYQCEATNALGSQSNSTKLQVQGSPRDTTLSITPSPVKEGDRVTFSCTTHSNPPAQLVLRRQSSSGWSELVSENGTWTIRDVQPADAGLYQCVATNALGSQSNSTKLQVQDLTNCAHSSKPVDGGGKVTIGCTIHNIPSTNFTLKKLVNNNENELFSTGWHVYSLFVLFVFFLLQPGKDREPVKGAWWEMRSPRVKGSPRAVPDGFIKGRGGAQAHRPSQLTDHRSSQTITAHSSRARRRRYAFNLELTPYGDVWARIGDKLELKCVANNCLSPTFSWRTGTDRPLGGKITTRGTTSTITFSAVTPHNELSYTCASKCGAEEKRKKVNLSVFSLSDTLTVESVGSLEVGRKGTVRCTVPKVYPAHVEVEWLKGTTLLKTDQSHGYAKDEMAINFTYELTAELGDSGQELTCRVRLLPDNPPGWAQGTLTLQVDYAPTGIAITAEPPGTVREGQDARLTCAAASSPAARTVWSKLSAGRWSVVAEDRAILHLSPALLGDTGTYRCEASNKLGTIARQVELQVQGSPRDTTLSITPSPVKEGDRVTFSCTTHSNPPAQLVLSRQSSSGWSELVSENGTWTIRAVQPADAGLYQCEATNALGSQSNSTKLQVQGSPRDTTLSITPSPVKEGDRVTFSCTTHSNPPAQLVLRRQSSSGWSELVSENGTWTIRDVQPADAGLYQCEATNALGSQSNSTKLQVQDLTNCARSSKPVDGGGKVTIGCTIHNIPSTNFTLKKLVNNNENELFSTGWHVYSLFVLFVFFLLF
ncbi:vascular cell adhesion protein 1b [Rhinoraja longicauda]